MNTTLSSVRLGQRAVFLIALLIAHLASASNAPTFGNPRTVNTSTHAGSMVMGDFDGDGTPDVAMLDVDSGKVEVQFGDGNGGFRAGKATLTVTDTDSEFAFTAADIDGGGQSELIVAAEQSVLVYKWDATNSVFALARTIDVNTPTGIFATSVSVGDLTFAPNTVNAPTTGGSRDIVVAGFGQAGAVWIPNDGTGHFGTPAVIASAAVNESGKVIAADVDGDGLADVVFLKVDPNTGYVSKLGVLLNKGDGSLNAEVDYGNSTLDATGTWMVDDLVVADVDGDGHPDLVLTGSVLDAQTGTRTFHLSVSLNNANGTFADGKTFDFTKNSGVSIAATAMAAADFNGDGRMDIATLIDAPGSNADPNGGITGFTITRFTGAGATLAIEKQDNFSNGGIAFISSIAVGYVKADGTFATFNNDRHPDVLIGDTNDFHDTTPSHSEFFLFQNTTNTIPNDNSISFETPNVDVVEGNELDVTIQRGTTSTWQVLVSFQVSGTAVQAGTGVKNPDYSITSPAQSQTVTFAVGESEKNIHLSIPKKTGASPDRTVVLTLLAPAGDAVLGADNVATVTISDTQPATLANPGALSVKPKNLVLPVPHGAGVSAIGRTGSDWAYSVSQMFPASAQNPRVKVQASLYPPDENQWADYISLVHGKGTSWTSVDRHPPMSTELYFRTVTSADGYPDKIGHPTPPIGVFPGPELGVQITAVTDSDVTGSTVHNNPAPGPEVITYQFAVSNSSRAEADASNAVLTVPIPPHTSFLNTTTQSSTVAQLTKNGKTVAVKWTFPTIPVDTTYQVKLLVTVDIPDFFSKVEQKTHPNGYGYIIQEKSISLDKNGFNLAAPSQGVTAANIVGFTEFDTEIIGSLKLQLSQSPSSANPGGLITYTLDCRNTSTLTLPSGYVATDRIPDHTVLATVYSFDNNGDATTTPLPNPGAFTNPAIIYAKAPVTPKVDASSFVPDLTGLTPAQATAKAAEIYNLLKPIFTAKAGAEVDVSAFNNDSFKLATLKLLVDNGFIVPERLKWTMGAIPGTSGGQSNVRSVAFSVRVPYDAAPLDAQGHAVVIVNDSYDFGLLDTTQTAKQKHLVFNPSALYGDTAQPIDVTVNNVPEPAAEPHLLLAKSALGDQNLNNPNFHGNGFSTLPAFGNVVTVAQNHGVDYVLTYRNDLDLNGQGADAHGVVLHDVIPQGMALRGFFTQNVNGSGAGPMSAGQFTFYDKTGAIIPGVDPTTNADNMAKVASMDIRLGSVSNLSVVPKGTFGTVRYTCSPTISSTTEIKYTPKGEPEGFFGGPGLIHSFGGFMPGQGLSGQFQGFYISTTDKVTPVQGGPTDCLVQVVADVSWNFPPPKLSVNDTQPFDVAPVDFNFTQNGDVSAPNSVITFTVPAGVTFLNGLVTPPNGAVVTSGNNHTVADGNTSFDCHPVLIVSGQSTPLTATISGSNVTLALGTVNGHASGDVRVFFQVNGPTLDPALKAMVKSDGGYHPINPHIIGSYAGVAPHLVSARFAATAQVSADAPASGTNPQKVHELSPPKLGISRSAPFSVMKSTASNPSRFIYTVVFTNTGDTDATQVTVGMQIPFRTDFLSTLNGQIYVVSGGTTTPNAVTAPWTSTPRSGKQLQPAGGSLHPGVDIVTWHIGTLPAKSTGQVNLVVQCDPRFADEGIGDNSLYISSAELGKVHIAANPITTWIIGTSLSDSKIRAAQTFFENAGVTVTPALAPAVSTLAASLTTQSQVQALASLDALQFPSLGVKVIPLGKNQVMVVSNDGGSIVSQGAGNILANDGATIVAAGAGNLISVKNVPAFGNNPTGTYDCATLLGNIPAIVAARAGSIVSAGAGNLISQDGLGILSNQPGGGIIAPASQVAGTAIQADGGSVVSNDGGTALAAGAPVVSNDGGTLINQDGNGLISQDGNGLISQDGNGLTVFGAGNALNGSVTK